MKVTPPAAIRISVTPEVGRALVAAKKMYPTLSDPEIFKLGLSKIIREENEINHSEKKEIMAMAAYSVGYDYLGDPEEDIYTVESGERLSRT